ncbi:MAG TPA: sterol desaturase family protein [Vicinamibacterales bacterium]|nr:sterol desaturase family protein [Vicinamibacterales bacterium]
MTVREFLNNTAILSTIMAVAAMIETAVPMFIGRSGTHGRRSANLGLTAVVFLLNWSLSSAVAVLALVLAIHPPTWTKALGLPIAAQVVAGIVILDFSAGYVSHRALHFFPVLWRFHQVHHSDDFVDVTTTYRTHPVETVWRFLFVVVPVWAIGIPPLAVVIQRLLSATNGILEHGNIRLWRPLERVLPLVWVTPNVHKMHHSRERAETNSNYGNVLTIYDRLFGTFTPSDRAETVVYGLDEADPSRIGSFGRLMSMPFQAETPSLTQKSGLGSAYTDNIPA